MTAVPICGAPALMVKSGRERTLVVADLHLGIEGELAMKGIVLPSQIPKAKARLIELIEKKKPNSLVLLGDVKHNVPISSWQEWRELPGFFKDLLKLTHVEIVRGNHDGDLEGMVPSEVVIHASHGIVIGKRRRIGLMHGHTWPAPELLNSEIIVAGHNHPAIEFRDELGGRTIEPIWLRAKLNPKKFPKKLEPWIKGRPPELLVMPSFSELMGGAAVNRKIPQELIGPMFKSGAVRLDEAEAYMLDGTLLGAVGNLK